LASTATPQRTMHSLWGALLIHQLKNHGDNYR
jgi:hypothetical protein